jgi:hypothetical protein
MLETRNAWRQMGKRHACFAKDIENNLCVPLLQLQDELYVKKKKVIFVMVFDDLKIDAG